MTDKFQKHSEELKAAQKEAFDYWMAQPTTRLMISMIPAGERQEVLSTLLQSAFEAGFANGGAITAVKMLGSIVKEAAKDSRQ